MSIDFAAVVRALKDIGYKGWFTLEADNYLKSFRKDNIIDGMKDLYSAVRRLADMFEKM